MMVLWLFLLLNDKETVTFLNTAIPEFFTYGYSLTVKNCANKVPNTNAIKQNQKSSLKVKSVYL